jgi:rhodanese-related sulfurtransferase
VTTRSIDAPGLAADMGRFQVVDVRYPNEWEAGHIDGAVHIPLDYLYEHTEDLDRARPVVTVCRSGSRSAKAAEELAGEGFDVQNLSGGMLAWVEQGLAIVDDDGGPGRVAEPEPPPDDRPAELQRLQDDFMGAVFAVRDHFGDREPSEEEVLAFLRARDERQAGDAGAPA